MKIHLSDDLVSRLRRQYPRCLIDTIAVADMVAVIVEQHLTNAQNTRRMLDEQRTVPDANLAPEPAHSR